MEGDTNVETQDLILEKEEISYEIDTPIGKPITFYATEIRKEKTGIHAELGIKFDDSDIYTVCNIKRREEQNKITRESYKFFGATADDADYICPKDKLIKEFSHFCKLVWPKWIEVQAPVMVTGTLNTSSVSYLAKPHILNEGGTIMYGKPGRGKSFTGIALAIAVHTGTNHYWETEKRNSVYVNLERPERTFAPRIGSIRRALGLNPEGDLPILHGKESTLFNVKEVLSEYIKENDIGFVVIDSLSQAGNGDMKEDTVASNTIKVLNQLGVSWLGIAHTPKYDDSVYYGNAMWEAGADVMIRHSSEIIDDDGSIAVLLECTKANDMPVPKPMGLHYSFDQYGLKDIRFAKDHEIADLSHVDPTGTTGIYEYLRQGGKSVTQLVKELKGSPHKIGNNVDKLYKDGYIELLPTKGNENIYGHKIKKGQK